MHCAICQDVYFKKYWVDCGEIRPSRQNIHWNKFSQVKKFNIANDLNKENFILSSAGIWKEKLSRAEKITEPAGLFKYTCKLLLERVSWYMYEKGGYAKIIFSNRRAHQLNKESLISYLNDIIEESKVSPRHDIKNVFNPEEIDIQSRVNSKMLMIADFLRIDGG